MNGDGGWSRLWGRSWTDANPHEGFLVTYLQEVHTEAGLAKALTLRRAGTWTETQNPT